MMCSGLVTMIVGMIEIILSIYIYIYIYIAHVYSLHENLDFPVLLTYFRPAPSAEALISGPTHSKTP